MDLAKWLGVAVLSIIMGFVFAGIFRVAVPSLPTAIQISLEIIGGLIILKALIDAARIGATIETDHGKQFD
jgi:hypothetical protein